MRLTWIVAIVISGSALADDSYRAIAADNHWRYFSLLEAQHGPASYRVDVLSLHITCDWEHIAPLVLGLDVHYEDCALLDADALWSLVSAIAPRGATSVRRHDIYDVSQGALGQSAVARTTDGSGNSLVLGRTERYYFHYAPDWTQLDVFARDFAATTCFVDDIQGPLCGLTHAELTLREKPVPGAPLTCVQIFTGAPDSATRPVARMLVEAAGPLRVIRSYSRGDGATGSRTFAAWTYPADTAVVPFPSAAVIIYTHKAGLQATRYDLTNLERGITRSHGGLIASDVKVFSYMRGAKIPGQWHGIGPAGVPAEVRELLAMTNQTPGSPVAATSVDAYNERPHAAPLLIASRVLAAIGVIVLVGTFRRVRAS